MNRRATVVQPLESWAELKPSADRVIGPSESMDER